jgi:hypothetical protein
VVLPAVLSYSPCQLVPLPRLPCVEWRLGNQGHVSHLALSRLLPFPARLCACRILPRPLQNRFRKKNYSKKSRNTLSSRLSFCCPTIMLFCPGAPTPCPLLSYQWTMLTVKVSLFHLQSIILSETFCDKNTEAAENGQLFKF